MTRRILIGLPLLLWLLAGVVLMTWLHVLAPWAWLLSLAPAAATVGIAATYWETPPERYLSRRLGRNRQRLFLSRLQIRRRSPSLPASVKSRP